MRVHGGGKRRDKERRGREASEVYASRSGDTYLLALALAPLLAPIHKTPRIIPKASV